MICPPCTHDCREGRDCPSIAINAQIVGYVEPQRTWVGLTDEDEIPWDGVDVKSFAKAIEAKLKEKNSA